MQRRALGASTAGYHLELLAARGTANATGGLINATRAGVPMLFSAGRTPLTEGSATGSRDATHDVRAAGGFGERLEWPDQAMGALERALHAVPADGRLALLNMVAA